MQKYCKAYHLKDLRQFSAWIEHHAELADDTIVYLWDDFTVVKSPVLAEQQMLWTDVTPEWQTFCKETLQFEIPADLQFAYKATTEA
jgi:hypothetical protein